MAAKETALTRLVNLLRISNPKNKFTVNNQQHVMMISEDGEVQDITNEAIALCEKLLTTMGIDKMESAMKSNKYGQQIPDYIELEDGEDWKFIDDHPRYIITTYGRVINIFTGRELKQSKHVTCRNKDSIYCIYEVSLANPEGSKTRYTTERVHKLVADAFLPIPEVNPDGSEIISKLCVNHKDGDTSNNHADNLEWCDLSYNSRQSKRHYTRGSKYGVSINMTIEELREARKQFEVNSKPYILICNYISIKNRENK